MRASIKENKHIPNIVKKIKIALIFLVKWYWISSKPVLPNHFYWDHKPSQRIQHIKSINVLLINVASYFKIGDIWFNFIIRCSVTSKSLGTTTIATQFLFENCLTYIIIVEYFTISFNFENWGNILFRVDWIKCTGKGTLVN